MGREFGRISGPLLADNLLRNGNNLAFDTQVLYVDVINGRIGANTTAPQTELYTPTAIDTTNIIIDNSSTIANFTVNNTGTFTNLTNSITFGQPIRTPGLSTTNLYLSGNSVVDTVTNNSINISPNGTGTITLTNDSAATAVTVNASLHATGNITFDGNVTLGSSLSNTITFAAEVTSNILPITNNAYTLGSSTNKWATVYTNGITVGVVNIPTMTASTLNAGNFSISGTTINNTSANQNFNLTASGTGSVKINGVKLFQSLNGNQIPNASSGAYSLVPSGAGYFKFGGTSGVTIPYGTTAQRPATAVTGMVRYNTSLGYGEVYQTGIGWIPIGGVSSSLTISQVTSILLTDIIIFGR